MGIAHKLLLEDFVVLFVRKVLYHFELLHLAYKRTLLTTYLLGITQTLDNLVYSLLDSEIGPLAQRLNSWQDAFLEQLNPIDPTDILLSLNYNLAPGLFLVHDACNVLRVDAVSQAIAWFEAGEHVGSGLLHVDGRLTVFLNEVQHVELCQQVSDLGEITSLEE